MWSVDPARGKPPRASCPPFRRGVGFSGNFLLEAPPPSPWKLAPGAGCPGCRGGARAGGGSESGTQEAQPPSGDPSKSCPHTSSSLVLPSPGPAVEVESGGEEPGRDLQGLRRQAGSSTSVLSTGGAPGLRPQDQAQTFWIVPGHLLGTSRTTRVRGATPGRQVRGMLL